MRTTVRLPPGLLARAKERAHRESTTLTALITEGLEMRICATAPRRKKVPPPPVSKARGGLRPGLEWDKLKEYDDAQFVEHMLAKMR